VVACSLAGCLAGWRDWQTGYLGGPSDLAIGWLFGWLPTWLFGWLYD